jgi:hypothetical protein
VTVPKGKGALTPLRLRPWQIELVGPVLDPDPPPSLAGWMLPRGQGMSVLVAAQWYGRVVLEALGPDATDEALEAIPPSR